MNNPYLLTLPQLMSAKKKIGRVAAFYDSSKTSLKGFEATVLTPTQFREQLRRGLDILVTDAELGALVFLFDKTGDGVVDSVEFVNEFFRLGKQERTKFLTTQAEETKRIAEWKTKKAEIKAKKFENFTYTRVATSWTQEEENEAIRKIATVAFSYDPNKGGLRAFTSSNYLTAAEFRELMRRNFEVFLSPEETGALLSMFDRDGLGLIDCKEFIYQFFRISRSEKEAHMHRNLSVAAARQEVEKERLAGIEEKFASAVVARMTPASEKDKQSAFEKVRHAAMCYKGDSAFSGNLWKSFESDALDPTAFKSLLRTNFEIVLSPGELDAIVRMFDANGDGNISCVEFITTFFRIALNERSHRLAIKREKDLKAILEREDAEKLKAQSAAAATQTRVLWPLLPNEDGDFPEHLAGLSPAEVPGPSVADVRTIMKHRARPRMRDILSPVRSGGGGGGGGGGSVTGGGSGTGGEHRSLASSRSGGGGGKNASLADLFPKASQDTRDFLAQLEQQEREIRLMGRSSVSAAASTSQAGSLQSAAGGGGGGGGGKRGKGKGNGKKQGKKGRGGGSGHYDGGSGGDGGEGEVDGEGEGMYGGTSLLDSSWGFADSTAHVGMIPGEFGIGSRGERPGTSAGNDYGGSRAASSAGGSRGGGGQTGASSHRNNVLTHPIEEEFGSATEGAEIPIIASVVEDEC